MFKNRLLILAAATAFGLPAGASTILNTFPDGPAGHTGGYLFEAETFVVGTDTVLSSFAFQMYPSIGPGVQIEVYAWGPTGPTGPALYTSPSTLRTNATLNLTISGINLALTQGNEYGVVIDNEGHTAGDAAYNDVRTSYTGGDLWLLSQDSPVWQDLSTLNLYFQADFESSGQTSGAPEPAAWAFMGLGLVTIGLLRRSRMVRH